MRKNVFLICLLILLVGSSAVDEVTDSTIPSTVPSTPQPTTVVTPASTIPANNDFSCAVCRSDNTQQADCAANSVTKYNTTCQFQPGTNETLKACYIWRTESNVVVRDCYTSAIALGYNFISKELCTSDIKSKCYLVDGVDSNTGKPPNSAASLKVSAILIAVLTFMVLKSF